MRTGLIVLFSLSCIYAIEHDSICDDDDDDSCPEPTHTVIRLAKRDDELARKLAAEHGMRVRGEPFLDSHYFLYHNDESHSRRRKRSAVKRLDAHPAVEWLSEQRARRRTKRDYLRDDSHPIEEEERRLSKRESLGLRRSSSNREMSKRRRQAVREIPHLPFPDPLYQDQWYLVGKAVGNYDMNVREAWLLGYAGRNVSVSILDDGIQRLVKDHPDLVTNYDPLASTDINDHDDDPTPQNNGDNKHGTRCAGEVAAIAGNNYCGVGVAFKAKIGGVRMLDGAVSDSVEAASLSLNQDHIDIYSASWGPEDDGKTFDGPGPLAREAFYRGIKSGRRGKGNIFVWASGNGGSR
ncbi:peptidase, S8/S53 family [Cooperia oncophora]